MGPVAVSFKFNVKSRFLIFIATVAAVLGLAAAYIGFRLTAWSPWATSHRSAVWLILAMVVVLQLLLPYLYRSFPDRFRGFSPLHWLAYTALGVFGCLFFYVVAVDVGVGLWALLFTVDDIGYVELLLATSLVSVTLVIGTAQALIGPRIYRVEIPLANLPAEFDGYRIVQITDVHLGPTIGRRYMRRCVELANTLDADIVALTGDFVDGSVAQLRQAVGPVADLQAKHGIFFIAGNHEYYWRAREWLDEFQRLGARGLVNEHVVLRRGAAELVLAGVTDYSAGGMVAAHVSDPAKSLVGAPPQALKILLAHHPSSHTQAAQAGFHLQLSGHTHGGQFFPFSLLVRLTHRYYKGLYQLENLWLYVSRGTGYWGPPLRFAVPAEITLVTLVRP